jgi:hypothetical protein
MSDKNVQWAQQDSNLRPTDYESARADRAMGAQAPTTTEVAEAGDGAGQDCWRKGWRKDATPECAEPPAGAAPNAAAHAALAAAAGDETTEARRTASDEHTGAHRTLRDELSEVTAAWPVLPAKLRAGLLLLIRSHTGADAPSQENRP